MCSFTNYHLHFFIRKILQFIWRYMREYIIYIFLIFIKASVYFSISPAIFNKITFCHNEQFWASSETNFNF